MRPCISIRSFRSKLLIDHVVDQELAELVGLRGKRASACYLLDELGIAQKLQPRLELGRFRGDSGPAARRRTLGQ